MKETINITIETIAGFKLYEHVAFFAFFAGFIICSSSGEYYTAIISLCTSIWVFTPSGYRQDCEFLTSLIDSQTEKQ